MRSGAGGLYILTLSSSVSARTSLDARANQIVVITGRAAAGAGVSWTYTGSGAAFRVGAGASLEISGIALAGADGSELLALEAGGELSVADSWMVPPAAARR